MNKLHAVKLFKLTYTCVNVFSLLLKTLYTLEIQFQTFKSNMYTLKYEQSSQKS